MSIENYHLSFLKSLCSADNGVGVPSHSINGFGSTPSTQSSPTSAPNTIESLLEPFGLQNSQADFAAALAQLTGQSVKQMDRQQASAIQRPTSFAGSSLFGASEFGNPLGAPGTPIGSQHQMSIGQNLVSASSPYSTPQLTPMATPNGQAPPPKNPKLYKTELCRSWMDHGRCNYGERCQYAHGELEKRPVPRHPKYKTEACQSFHQSGYCPYGPRCHFIHNEPPSAQSQYSTPISTPVPHQTTPSLYASQYHNVTMKQQQPTQNASNVPNNVLQRVYSLPNGGYGSAGESPPCSSNDSGSESPNGSFSPGLDLEDSGPFSAGFLSASPHKLQQQKTNAAPRVPTSRFLSYDQSNLNDSQFSNLLNDICQWNIEDSLSTPFSGFLPSKWSTTTEETSPATTTPVSTPGRLPVFAQLSNPQ
ncbi:C3H1-type domain-containing protein [Caenorhabditis elegans]|uniref:C3H1-type domain-containing protein n=1 Tax=Caenorhabditis elegans TaxID=6239 RepID=Q7YXD9_CAEEL|nr:C3H1-type domain-containing protein [Caenorhabditis elegans]CAA98476.2 C3H1-type domain-containing protein [Caenorhabditis elegans]|eukprot:NP_505927.2 CCCH-type zinc finger putative transcription factor [Caenorhabditis elegans]